MAALNCEAGHAIKVADFISELCAKKNQFTSDLDDDQLAWLLELGDLYVKETEEWHQIARRLETTLQTVKDKVSVQPPRV